jgi:short-subunit dehydrogenase
MKILADELENTPVNVCGLLPGKVRTAFRTYAYPAEDKSGLSSVAEVATAAACLLSESGTKVNGKTTHGEILQLEKLAPATA